MIFYTSGSDEASLAVVTFCELKKRQSTVPSKSIGMNLKANLFMFAVNRKIFEVKNKRRT